MEELVKMSGKGQLVVPESIRTEEGFEAGDRFVPVAVEGGVLFKRVNMPDMAKELSAIMKNLQKRMKEQGVTQKDVDEAVKWVRKKRSLTRM